MTEIEANRMDEIDYELGPFYDVDGSEIFPVGFEESVIPLEQSMGWYTVKSKLPDIHGIRFPIQAAEFTHFIQQDWNRIMAGNSPRGFLLATRAGAYSAGRIAEEVVLHKLLTGRSIFGASIQAQIPFWQACDSGIVQRVKGIGSDDIVLRLDDGRLVAVESKASYRGTRYLRRSLPKVELQLKATVITNPNLAGVLAAMIDLNEHIIRIVGASTEQFLTSGLDWNEAD
jgi:hypothetical protein